LPTRLRTGEKLLTGGRVRADLGVGLGERLIDGRDAVRDAPRLKEQLLGLSNGVLELGQRRVGLARQVPGLTAREHGSAS